MVSLRLDSDLDGIVRRAAAREGESVSEFIRTAAAERAAKSLPFEERFPGIIGAVHSSGESVAERSGEAFAEALEQDMDT